MKRGPCQTQVHGVTREVKDGMDEDSSTDLGCDGIWNSNKMYRLAEPINKHKMYHLAEPIDKHKNTSILVSVIGKPEDEVHRYGLPALCRNW
uniref:Uncharacterized protein n=1 Tax=Peronospora matthiolae TaxID=2874970 RepID=A0AAV1T6I3_9STRA